MIELEDVYKNLSLVKLDRNINIFIDFLNGASITKLNVLYEVKTSKSVIYKLAEKIHSHHYKEWFCHTPSPNLIRSKSDVYMPYAKALLEKSKLYKPEVHCNAKEIAKTKAKIERLEIKLNDAKLHLKALQSEK
jgi:hypothetical protein